MMSNLRCWFVFLVTLCVLTMVCYYISLKDVNNEIIAVRTNSVKTSKLRSTFEKTPQNILRVENNEPNVRSNETNTGVVGISSTNKEVLHSKMVHYLEADKEQILSYDDYKYLKAYLIITGTEIRKALTHARGIKTRKYLHQSLSEIGLALRMLGEKFPAVINRKIGHSSHICPEVYNHSQFMTSRCSYGEPIAKLLTVVLVDRHYNSCVDLYRIMKSIKSYNPDLRVILGLSKCMDMELKLGQEFVRTLNILLFTTRTTLGKILNDLVGQVETIYVLIGRDIMYFDSDVQLERIIREMESLNLVSVGGAIRNISGYWRLGCLQRVYQNYSMLYTPGYDESYHDCVFCDHIQGPFVIRSDQSQHTEFDPELNITGVYEDYFYRLKGEVAICPDSMFYVHEPLQCGQIKKWTPFMEKYKLYKLSLPPLGPDIVSDCRAIEECEKNGGQVISPCCLKELASLINNVMKTCIDADLNCELEDGTLLGALKLNKVPPWERGGDIRLYYKNFAAFGDLTKTFRDMGYVLVNKQNAVGETFVRGYQQGKYDVCSDNWCVEVRTMPMLDTLDMKRNKIPPTLILHNGDYVTAARNPALTSRNRYAPEIFRHAEHHTVLMINSWDAYPTGRFTNCEEKGEHFCLENYNGDGNLQFEELLP